MDYFRNSFAKNIDGIVTLYDVRYSYNKNKSILHSDEGLKEKFKSRLLTLLSLSNCPLMISALEEILECLDEPFIDNRVNKEFKDTFKDIPVEDDEEEIQVKKRVSPFSNDSNNLEEFFQTNIESSNVLEEFTLELIKKALEKYDFNLTRTSRHLGISPRTLRVKIQEIKKRESGETVNNH
jgi:Bacterial regulatory protein, Fis family